MIISCLSKMEIIVEQKYDQKDNLHIMIIFHKVCYLKDCHLGTCQGIHSIYYCLSRKI